MSAPRSCWWRSFSTPRDSSFFLPTLREELPAGVRRDLQVVRDLLDEANEERPGETPVDIIRSLTAPLSEQPAPRPWRFADVSAGERVCWTTVVILLGWFAWAVMNAANFAPGP